LPAVLAVLAGCADANDGMAPPSPPIDVNPTDTHVEAIPPNTAPSCAITAPETGGEGSPGDTVYFEATVSDVDVPADSLSVTWESNKDGVIGTSTPDTDGTVLFATSSLSTDIHTISMRVSDGAEGTCTDSIVFTVWVNPPSIESVTLGPDPAVAGDALICDYEGFVSPMEGPDLSTFSWRINSLPVAATGSVLSEGSSSGDTVTCTVTPEDGFATGPPLSDSVVIDKTPRYDPTPTWPLCGRITEDPPADWTETNGCPSERWGSSDYTDYPISSTFGPRLLPSGNFRYDFHRGLDLSTPVGTPVFAVAPGDVLKAGNDPSYADPVVQVRHYRPGSEGSCTAADGCWHTNYMHLSTWEVSAGETVVRGQLLGHTGASASGYAHLHFEVRDARASDPKSVWQRDTIHPLVVLPYTNGSSGPELTIEAADTSVWTAPSVDILVAFREPTPELDMIRVAIRVYELDAGGDYTEVPQPYATPWFVNPPFFDVNAWNLQYTHKNSSAFPWDSFADCPHAPDHGATYDAHVHLDRADPVAHDVGLFNGVRITPNHYNQSKAEWLVEFRFLGLTAPDGASDLRFVAELTDARDTVLASAPFDVSAP
jgi:murein DD-endopeptidase MepM/ murein hydrolase activator NlpD